MAEAIARSTQTVVGYAVLVVDLDDFKPINDVHGHSIGDVVLVEVARRLKIAVRDCDTVSRLGGDEFAVIPQVDLQAGGQASVPVLSMTCRDFERYQAVERRPCREFIAIWLMR
jgi:diguanylate cyclase (GGDEF)-like protein